MRSSIEKRSNDVAGVLVGVADAAVHAEPADDVEDDVLGVDARARAGRSPRCGGPSACSIARLCVASTSRTCEVPMPKAIAPNAPWVEVCESPQQIVMPGWVRPRSGPITCTMPCSPLRRREEADAELARSCARGAAASPRPAGRRAGARWLCVGMMWSTVAKVRSGKSTVEPALAQHREGLRRRHLVDEVQAHEQLVLAGRQAAHRVGVEDLVVQRRVHRTSVGSPWTGSCPAGVRLEAGDQTRR